MFSIDHRTLQVTLPRSVATLPRSLPRSVTRSVNRSVNRSLGGQPIDRLLPARRRRLDRRRRWAGAGAAAATLALGGTAVLTGRALARRSDADRTPGPDGARSDDPVGAAVRTLGVVDDDADRPGAPSPQAGSWSVVTVLLDPAELDALLSLDPTVAAGPSGDPGDLLPLARLADAVEVTTRPAPGGRGTEVFARPLNEPTGLQRWGAWLTGSHPRRQVRVALRETKQLVETGQVLRGSTDATPATGEARTAGPVAQPDQQPDEQHAGQGQWQEGGS